MMTLSTLKPPSTPALLDERTARSVEELDRIRDRNEALIREYMKAYRRYVSRVGNVIPYDAGTSSLPDSQRAYYDAVIPCVC